MGRIIFLKMCIILFLSLSLIGCKVETSPGETTVENKLAPTQNAAPAAIAPGKTKIRWFVGVGTGRTVEAVNAAKEFVAQFNASHEKIHLELEVVTSSTHDAIDRLMAEIEEGDPPDLVAPADKGWAGEQLTDYILPFDAALVSNDLSDIDSEVLDAWRVDRKLIGLPIGIFPSAIFYNQKLFDAAGLPYPPHKFGEPYADGEPWTISKMTAVARQLTLDAKGRNSTDPDFDPGSTKQWGYHWQWDSTRSMAVMFGAGSMIDESGRAAMPQNWRDAFIWYYDGIWKEYFIPNAGQVATMQGNPFRSGKVAMVHTYLWYSPRLVNFANWDLAAVPAYQGTVTSKMELDGAIILNTTTHPAEAIEVAYAIASSPELLLAWEMLPTFRHIQSQSLENLQAKHPGVDFQVMVDSLKYGDTTYENIMPNYRKSYDRLLAFRDRIGLDGNLSLDAEIAKLETDLQALFEEEP
jgi:multiple sugar transport system substrate-binding protein